MSGRVGLRALTVGQRFRTNFNEYVVEVTTEPTISTDLFGRPVYKFQAVIVDGPSRIGESGGMTFGPNAEVEVL